MLRLNAEMGGANHIDVLYSCVGSQYGTMNCGFLYAFYAIVNAVYLVRCIVDVPVRFMRLCTQ